MIASNDSQNTQPGLTKIIIELLLSMIELRSTTCSLLFLTLILLRVLLRSSPTLISIGSAGSSVFTASASEAGAGFSALSSERLQACKKTKTMATKTNLILFMLSII